VIGVIDEDRVRGRGGGDLPSTRAMQPGSTEVTCSKSRFAWAVLEATTATDQIPLGPCDPQRVAARAETRTP